MILCVYLSAVVCTYSTDDIVQEAKWRLAQQLVCELGLVHQRVLRWLQNLLSQRPGLLLRHLQLR